MWTQVSGGNVTRVITSPTSLTVNDVTHPSSIFTKWTKVELKNIGIYPYREDSVNHRYHYSGAVTYTVLDDEVVGSYTQTDKDVAGLKEGMITQTRQSASSFLARDDWMSIREAEGGTVMPDDVKAYRIAVREESNDKETAIEALSNLDAVKLYEATPYIETRKNDDGEEYESERHLDLVTHYFTDDPLTDDDPAFVSLVKK